MSIIWSKGSWIDTIPCGRIRIFGEVWKMPSAFYCSLKRRSIVESFHILRLIVLVFMREGFALKHLKPLQNTGRCILSFAKRCQVPERTTLLQLLVGRFLFRASATRDAVLAPNFECFANAPRWHCNTTSDPSSFKVRSKVFQSQGMFLPSDWFFKVLSISRVWCSMLRSMFLPSFRLPSQRRSWYMLSSPADFPFGSTWEAQSRRKAVGEVSYRPEASAADQWANTSQKHHQKHQKHQKISTYQICCFAVEGIGRNLLQSGKSNDLEAKETLMPRAIRRRAPGRLALWTGKFKQNYGAKEGKIEILARSIKHCCTTHVFTQEAKQTETQV